MNQGSQTPEPALKRPLKGAILASSTIRHTSVEIGRVEYFSRAGLSGPGTGRTKQFLSAGKLDGHRPGRGSEAAVPTDSRTPWAPSPRALQEELWRPQEPGKARPAAWPWIRRPSWGLSLPPWPRAGCLSGARACGAAGLYTPPSAARLPAPLTLEGGRSGDAHHRQAPPPRTSSSTRGPGPSRAPLREPVAAKLADPNAAAAAAVTTAAVRPRAAPPPVGPAPPAGHAPAARSRPPDKRTRKPGPKIGSY